MTDFRRKSSSIQSHDDQVSRGRIQMEGMEIYYSYFVVLCAPIGI